ncbi:MAG: TIGR04150 pseudo-rSAM protein [Bacteroidota bacterium]
MEKTYLCLYPQTFIWDKGEEGLIFNSQHGCGFRYSNQTIKEITKALSDLKNLHCIELDFSKCDNQELNHFIENIIRIKAGEVVKLHAEIPKPVIIPPLLNLQSDVFRLLKQAPKIAGENVLDYLHEITIHIDTDVDGTTYMLSRIFKIVSCSKLVIIHIKGSNMFKLSDQMTLLDQIGKMITIKYIHEKLDNMKHEFLNNLSTRKFMLMIEVDNYECRQKISEMVSMTKELDINARWIFYVRNEEEYQKADMFIKKYKIPKCEISPVFNGENLFFFRDHIFIDENDLIKPELSKREIFAHQALNTNDFGKLTIMPDGKVYANPYFPALGTIEDDIRELIYRELIEGKSWLRIRDMEPCCNCVYQWLCPSPSDYELAIGKPNLCHIIPY